uniref:Tc1-like transposase DDE domain-containing protein n=1 Tax=Cyprinus carpio carpio TaxID=630221 RepID=A0A9J7WZK0_CYPCA
IEMFKNNWKRVLWSDESVFQVFFGRNGRRVLRTKEEKDHPDCYQQQVQKPGSVMVWGCVSALGKGNLHFCEGTINAEKYIEILEHNMLPSRRHLFQGRPCIFQQDNAKPHSAHITKSWLRRKRLRVLDWPACSPDLSPIENVWRILKRPKTVEKLEACIRQEWDNIPIPKLEQLVSSVPRRLQTVIKRRGDDTQ